MPNDDGQKPGGSLSISIGKEIDSALGDVIRGLLKRPSEELGGILADGIGILGDKVKRKRFLNAQFGLQETRDLLESRNVSLKDITPPSEEELYIVLEGMSISGDSQLRKLWAGLLGNSLDPNGRQSIQRPITSTISSLSPSDVRVIEYAAYVSKTNRQILKEARSKAGVEERAWLTVGEANRIEAARREMGARLLDYMSITSQMELDFDIVGIASQETWPDNMVRLGLIRPRPEDYSSSVRGFRFRGERDDGKFEAVIEHLERRIEEAETLALGGLRIESLRKRNEEKLSVDLGFEFSRFGEIFCTACGIG